MVELILGLFKPDTVFSLTFFLAFLGLGWFFNFSFWPWWKTHQDTKQKMQHEIKLKEIEIEQKRQDRWDTVIDTIGQLKEEMGAFRQTLDIIMAHLIDNWFEKKKSG